MKICLLVVALIIGVASYTSAQGIEIDSIERNGSISFNGAVGGTTATVQWAASLTEDGRTNWHDLANVVVSLDTTTADIPMFFRIMGIPNNDIFVTNGLVIDYLFDGNANDLSGNGFDGTVNGAVLTSDRFGSPNQAYYFNGSANIIRESYTGSSSVSVSLWFNADADEVKGRFIDDVDIVGGWGEVGYDTGSVYVHFYGSQYFSGHTEEVVNLSAGSNLASSWHHVVAIYQSVTTTSGVAKVYLDGTLRQSVSVPWALMQSTTSLRIGGVTQVTEFFKGSIDDVRIYHRALSALDVSRLYRTDTSTLNNGLLAFWQLNDNGTDSSTNLNHLTISNMVAVADKWGSPSNAMSLNGTNAYGVSLNPLPNCDSFSFSGWLWLTNHITNQAILFEGDTSQARDVALSSQVSDSTFRTKDNDTLTFASTNMPLNQWFHLVAVADSVGQRKQIWVNGGKIAESVWTGTANNGYHYNAQLGRWYDGGGSTPDGYFGGKMDQVRLYGRALTPQEIDTLYNVVR